ncbi:VOC family protein [Rhodanobacter umsongensis]|uniref:VOC family protein n=1 Tax=Rhodanobacter umsongensis TaxID=633153 RepID=A0ABW0JGS2_9GAMM
MKNSLLSLLAVAALGVAAFLAPWSSPAATFHDADYVRIGVPDLAQAVSFFQDVLDCQLVGATPATSSMRNASSRLLVCEAGSIVELVDDRTGVRSSSRQRVAGTDGEPIRFISGNVAHADQWLRGAGVRVVGPSQKLRSGPFVGMTAVNFVSPWGLRLQLVGPDTNVAASGR